MLTQPSQDIIRNSRVVRAIGATDDVDVVAVHPHTITAHEKRARGRSSTQSFRYNTILDAFDSVIGELRKERTQEECLRKAYEVLTERYYGHRWKNFTRLFRLWPSSVETLWKEPGHMHCTNINRILKALLTRSGHFSEEDVELRWTLLWWISPHQYVRVRLSKGKTIHVDVWAQAHRIRFGDYAHGWHAFGSH